MSQMFFTTYANDYAHSQLAKDINSIGGRHIWARYNTFSMEIVIISTYLVMLMSHKSGNYYMYLEFLMGRCHPRVFQLYLINTGRWKQVYFWEYVLKSYLLMKHEPKLEIGKEELVDLCKNHRNMEDPVKLKTDGLPVSPLPNERLGGKWCKSWHDTSCDPLSVTTRPSHSLCYMADLWW